MILAAIAFVLYPVAMWLMYILCIGIVIAEEKYGFAWWQYPFIFPVVLIGYVMDIIFNIVYMTIATRELPRELLTTTRCKRLKDHMTWAGKVARFVCRRFLHPFDATHCGELP